MADALGKLQVKPCFISAVGNEHFGLSVLDTISHVSTKGILKSKDKSTGTCIVLCDNTGECPLLVADMDIHGTITPSHVQNYLEDIALSSLVVLDGNLPQDTIEYVLRHCREKHVPVWFEPTDIFKGVKPFLNEKVPPPTFISPNLLEFRKIFKAVHPEAQIHESDLISECVKKGYILAQLVDNIIITLGEEGVMIIRKGKKTDGFFIKESKAKILERHGPISHRVYKPALLKKEEIANVSGAGDCFASGFIAAMLRGESEEDCVEFGFQCSIACLKSSRTVPKQF